jgi:hypothetical protein
MPRPVFILCAQSWAFDEETKLCSFFHVLEGISTSRSPTTAWSPISFNLPLQIVGVAEWMRTEADSDSDEFEYELSFAFPDQPKIQVISGRFKFMALFQRFISRAGISSPPASSGVILFESRIRKVGTQKWMSQDFPIPFTVNELVPQTT